MAKASYLKTRPWMAIVAVCLLLIALGAQAEAPCLEETAAQGEATAVAGEAPPAAQPAAASSGGWHYQADLYGWGAGMSGTVGYPAIKEYEGHVSFSDILKNLDSGFMAHFEAQNGKWGILVDPIYVNLGHTAYTPRRDRPIKLNFEYLQLGVVGAYRMVETPSASLDFTFGPRYNGVTAGMTPYCLEKRSKDMSFVDLVLGLKGGVRMSPHWTFGYRFDVGGFWTGSDFTWSGRIRFDGQVSKHTYLGFGYMAYSLDHSTGSGFKEFKAKVTMQGPALGISWKW